MPSISEEKDIETYDLATEQAVKLQRMHKVANVYDDDSKNDIARVSSVDSAVSTDKFKEALLQVLKESKGREKHSETIRAAHYDPRQSRPRPIRPSQNRSENQKIRSAQLMIITVKIPSAR